MRHRVNALPAIPAEEEELRFRANVEGPAALRYLCQCPLEDTARVSFERISIRRENIAEDTGAARLGRTPRQDRISGGVNDQPHVAFLDAGKTFDGGAIKPDAIF